jgi:hypothetical protein
LATPTDAGANVGEIACPAIVLMGTLDTDWADPAAEGAGIVAVKPAGLGTFSYGGMCSTRHRLKLTGSLEKSNSTVNSCHAMTLQTLKYALYKVHTQIRLKSGPPGAA